MGTGNAAWMQAFAATGAASVALLFGAAEASAVDRCVNPGGTDGCFSTIPAAIAASNPTGDAIDVAVGTYNGNVHVNKGLTIRGAGAGQTILDAQRSNSSVLSTNTDEDVTVSDLTVRETGDDFATRASINPDTPTASATPTHTFERVAVEGIGSNDNGILATGQSMNLVLRDSSISGTAFTPIQIVSHAGTLDIDGNTVEPHLVGGASITDTAQNGQDSPLPHRIRNNTIARGVSVVGSANGSGDGFADVQITGNETGSPTLPASSPAINLENADAVAGGTEGVIDNAVVRDNSITASTPLGTSGVRIRGVVTDAEIRANSISGFATGVLADDTALGGQTGTSLAFNRIVGNAAGLENSTADPIAAENNWWGCNAGPGGAGCDATTGTGTIDAEPRLALGVDVNPASVLVGGATANATAGLARNSSGQIVAGPFFTGSELDFAGTGGTVAPDEAPLPASGSAQATFTSGATTGPGSVKATLDNQTATGNLTIADPPTDPPVDPPVDPPTDPGAPADSDGDGVPDELDPEPNNPSIPGPFGATNGDDVLDGTAAGETICGLLGNDVIDALDGDDVVFGDECGTKARRGLSTAGGNDTLSGGEGEDELYGAAGKDMLSGDDGDDRLVGGEAKNSYDGGPGNDFVDARNRVKEKVICGKGKKDRAKVDKKDKAKGCEKVKRPK